MADTTKAALANFTFGNATIITPPNVIRISLAPAGSGAFEARSTMMIQMVGGQPADGAAFVRARESELRAALQAGGLSVTNMAYYL